MMMPVIVREGPWRMTVYTDEHGQPHVHALHPDGWAKILLGAQDQVPIPVRVVGLGDHQVWRAVQVALEHRESLLHAWRNIHG